MVVVGVAVAGYSWSLLLSAHEHALNVGERDGRGRCTMACPSTCSAASYCA